MSESQVRHIVLFHISEDESVEQIAFFFSQIVALKTLIPGIISISYGPQNSDEGLSKGFNWVTCALVYAVFVNIIHMFILYKQGMCIVFVSAAARDNYLPHPEHEKVKDIIIPMLKVR